MTKIVATVPVEPGQTFNIYTHNNLEVGQQVQISHPTGYTTGTVTANYADTSRYQDHELCGGKVINSGTGYYKVTVDR